MDLEEFWKIIEDSQDECQGRDDAQCQALLELLAELELADILLWKKILDSYMELSDRPGLWAAAYLINSGCDEECFHDFRAWLISQGREVYLAALVNPDSLAEFPREIKCAAECEALIHVPALAYSLQKGLEAPDYDGFHEELLNTALPDEIREEMENEILYGDGMDETWEVDELPESLPELYAVFAG
ncbi:DUF4240 domain-containing protein [Desulfovibrio sp. OttesenSCG-928-C14]|nr:DUF4240 domain-containing protein [Desulfovibrio sp. OttesenSCG-928-C14]